ncbi:MAG: twin-arginine translocase TatA/TatE family subunit [Bdellovibrionota bacterium]
MFGLGFGELIVILVIIVLVFGVGRLPELGTALGEGIKNFKKGYRESKSLDVTPPGSDQPAPRRDDIKN